MNREVLIIASKLGLTAFGGPIAHVGYFRDAFVTQHRWIDDARFARYLGVAQFLPGPTSSQVMMMIGHHRGGWPGLFSAWLGFTWPAALFMLLVGALATSAAGLFSQLLPGAAAVAVVVVAKALWGMAQTLCPDQRTRIIAALAAMLALLFPGLWGQLLALTLGLLVGLSALEGRWPTLGRPSAWLLVFFATLGGLFLLGRLFDSALIDLVDSTFRSGSLVFGGGHVVLPLLRAETVDQGLLTEAQFMAGYGLAQAMPGPLFAFAGYLGFVGDTGLPPLLGWAVATIAIFGGSVLLVPVALAITADDNGPIVKLLSGLGPAVVGLLFAAFVTPVLSAGLTASAPAGQGVLIVFAALLFLLLRLPVPLVVVLTLLAGMVVA